LAAVTRLVFSPHYTVDLGGHVFPTEKFQLAARLLAPVCRITAPREPAREDMLLAHDPDWVDKAISGRMSLADETLMELPFTPRVARAHRLQAAGTILACRHALKRGAGLHAGGGSHHAFRGHGEGFCVINDIAIGILKMRAEGRIRRAAVIDLDVHQGNGTAAIFADDPDTFTFSMHQKDLYPEIKERSSLDVELRAGMGDRAYLDRLRESLPAVFEHKPELVIYQAGVDGWERDLLGGLKLSAAGLRARDELVRKGCQSHGVAVAVTLGGGYARDVMETARLHAQTLLVFAGRSEEIS